MLTSGRTNRIYCGPLLRDRQIHFHGGGIYIYGYDGGHDVGFPAMADVRHRSDPKRRITHESLRFLSAAQSWPVCVSCSAGVFSVCQLRCAWNKTAGRESLAPGSVLSDSPDCDKPLYFAANTAQLKHAEMTASPLKSLHREEYITLPSLLAA